MSDQEFKSVAILLVLQVSITFNWRAIRTYIVEPLFLLIVISSSPLNLPDVIFILFYFFFQLVKGESCFNKNFLFLLSLLLLSSSKRDSQERLPPRACWVNIFCLECNPKGGKRSVCNLKGGNACSRFRWKCAAAAAADAGRVIRRWV